MRYPWNNNPVFLLRQRIPFTGSTRNEYREYMARINEMIHSQYKLYVCVRCAGYGGMDQFLHVESGVCFKCNGSGMQPKKPYLAY
jgi:hypothetical protein